ncbi:MAG: sugar kinase [Chitinophagaceae bacterium]
MSRVLCFGELLLRLSPELGGHWLRNSSMPVYIGGAELNVATALAKWEVPVSYLTALPDNYLSNEILSSLQDRGIVTRDVILSEGRIGSYYLPQGADLKNAGVIYDRAHSAFAQVLPAQIDWDSAFAGVSWFHFSAISPALNEAAALVCLEAVKEASARGIYISVDLNYRAKLWQWGKAPGEVMPDLVAYCNLVMGNIWAAEKMLNIPIEGPLVIKRDYLEQSRVSSAAILRSFEKCSAVANTFRFDKEKGLYYYTTLFESERLYESKEYITEYVIDKVGSGDCFMAGLIYGYVHKGLAQEIIDFATAAAFSKLFIKGDATSATAEDIKKGYFDYA